MLKLELAIAAMREILQDMTNQVTEMSRKINESFRTADFTTAHGIISMDEKVDFFEKQIDRLVAELLALINPMASDFRYIYSVIKINMDLERIGDQCKNIAKEFPKLETPIAPELIEMSDKVHESVKDICKSLLERDTMLARDIIRRDAEIDALELVILNKYAPSYALILTVRALERMADHCTNIAEYLVYAVEGLDIREFREKHKISGQKY
jgi:phosphate transport system protein